MLSLRNQGWWVALALASVGCSGGGGGGGGGSGPFALSEVEFGRALGDDRRTTSIVSPLTTVDTDPETTIPLAPSLADFGSGDVNQRVPFGLGFDFRPPVVPRNSALVLCFSRDLDENTVIADRLDGDCQVLESGTVRLRWKDGRGVPLRLSVRRGNEIWIDPRTETSIAFPPSPLSFDSRGRALVDPTGTLVLSLAFSDERVVLRSTAGEPLSSRDDGWGTERAIAFNPGNEQLDFINEGELLAIDDRFQGFLPDERSPRIVRRHRWSATWQTSAGDDHGGAFLTDADANFEAAAKAGRGEWAGGRLTLRPGRPDEERHLIERNSSRSLFLASPFSKAPSEGDAYQLSRLEYFEPSSLDPIDGREFDPANPQNAANEQLASFIEVREIDDQGQPVGPVLSLDEPIPAFSELRIRFDESLNTESLSPWENCLVRSSLEELEGEIPTVFVTNAAQSEVRLLPAFEASDGSLEVVGWGANVQALQLVVRTVPRVEDLETRLSATQLQRFLREGRRPVQDLTGQPLAYPLSLVDPLDPVIEFVADFQSDESKSSASPPPQAKNVRMLVHRFRGTPSRSTDSTGRAGIIYGEDDLAWAPLGEVNRQVNGYLASPPSIFLTRIFDDFHPPSDGLSPVPDEGVGFPLTSAFDSSVTSAAEHNGARFQHLYRDVDASPGTEFDGSFLDLYRVSFSPSSGEVVSDVYEDISIHAAVSPIRPITRTIGGSIPIEFTSGLGFAFDYDQYASEVLQGVSACDPQQEAPNYYRNSMVTVVKPGTTWMVAPSKVYTVPTSPRVFHPWPEFRKSFPIQFGDVPDENRRMIEDFNKDAQPITGMDETWRDFRVDDPGGRYDNRGGDSLLLEYRVRPQAEAVSRRNSFSYSPGIGISATPYFRLFSLGERGRRLFPDDNLDRRNRCATPAFPGFPPGDTARYLAVFDYEKRRSRVTSSYLASDLTNGELVSYRTAAMQPPACWLPAGSTVQIEYSGADTPSGEGATRYSGNPAVANGKAYLSLRITLLAGDGRVSPAVDWVAIPFELPRD